MQNTQMFDTLHHDNVQLNSKQREKEISKGRKKKKKED